MAKYAAALLLRCSHSPVNQYPRLFYCPALIRDPGQISLQVMGLIGFGIDLLDHLRWQENCFCQV